MSSLARKIARNNARKKYSNKHLKAGMYYEAHPEELEKKIAEAKSKIKVNIKEALEKQNEQIEEKGGN